MSNPAAARGTALAAALRVNIELLELWLGGEAEPPDAAYFAALEIVARGPFNGKPRG